MLELVFNDVINGFVVSKSASSLIVFRFAS